METSTTSAATSKPYKSIVSKLEENDPGCSSDDAKSGKDSEEKDNGSVSGSGNDDGSGGEDGDSESSGAEERAKLADDESFIVSGSADGELIVWHLFSGTPVCFLNTDGCPLALSRKARADYAARTVNDFPKLEIKDSGSIEVRNDEKCF